MNYFIIINIKKRLLVIQYTYHTIRSKSSFKLLQNTAYSNIKVYIFFIIFFPHKKKKIIFVQSLFLIIREL